MFLFSPEMVHYVLSRPRRQLLASATSFSRNFSTLRNERKNERLLNSNTGFIAGCLPIISVRTSQHLSVPPARPSHKTTPTYSVPYLRISSESEAHELVYFLKKPERELLHRVLSEHIGTKDGAVDTVTAATKENLKKQPLTKEQTKLVFLCNALPFIGFGILDNLLMIIAGEYIDHTFGVLFGLSTMAAAGLGNIISDIAGVGTAHYVEFLVAKFFNVKPPPLTAEQWDSGAVRWTTNGGRCAGLVIGCLIGMFPLFFFDEKEKQEKKLQAKISAAESPS